MELAGIIAANAPLGIQVTKLAARKFIEAGEAAAAAAIPEIQATVMGTEDAKEGIRSFVERRPAVFRGE
jgi:enoyl-CoA hydratase/carnithine racemase